MPHPRRPSGTSPPPPLGLAWPRGATAFAFLLLKFSTTSAGSGVRSRAVSAQCRYSPASIVFESNGKPTGSVRLTGRCQPPTGSIGHERSSSLRSFPKVVCRRYDGPIRKAVLHHGHLPAQTVCAAPDSCPRDNGQATLISRLRANEEAAMRLSALRSSAGPDTRRAGMRGSQLQGADRTKSRWPRAGARTGLRTPVRARPAVSTR